MVHLCYFCVLTLLSVAFVWAAVTELDNVVRAKEKQLRANCSVIGTGVVRARYVEEGDIVEKVAI